MKKVRSDSTLSLRTRLNNDYVITPKVLNTRSIQKYIDVLNAILKSANQFDKKNLLSQSYIDYKKFLVLYIALSKHNEYKSKQYSNTISLLDKDAKNAFERLESIVFRMDEAEDKRLALEQKDSSILELIDQFDNSDITVNQSLNNDQQQSHEIWTDLMKLKNNSILSSSSSSSSSSLKSTTSPFDVLNLDKTTFHRVEELIIPTVDNYPNVTSLNSLPLPLSDQYSISSEDIQICSYLKDIRSFYIPPPFRGHLNINIGNRCYQFIKDDFHTTFSAFLTDIPDELQMARGAVETNRCFFLHLAVAMNIHPFALQIAFRYLATKQLLQCSKEDMKVDVLNTVNAYAGFVDAYCLCFLWLQEFNSSRICIISGSEEKPMFSCFSLKDVRNSRDIIIYCDGSHFTLLKPYSTTVNSDSFCILPQLLTEAEHHGHIVHINEIETNDNQSISNIIYMLTSS